jgi:hypothetical protein
VTGRGRDDQPAALARTSTNAEPSANSRVLSGLIFTVSSGMVGVCLTVVGVFNAFRNAKAVEKAADTLVACDALVFLSSCMLAYLALRAVTERSWRRLERVADVLFLLGLMGMVVIATMIASDFV